MAPIYAKQVMAHKDHIWVIDGAGQLWVSRLDETRWELVTLPEAPEPRT